MQRVVPKRVTVQDMQEWNPSKSPVPFSCRKHAKLSLLITVLNLIARVLEDSKISDTILVVEDDVLISPGLLRALPLMLQSVPPDWDTLRLDCKPSSVTAAGKPYLIDADIFRTVPKELNVATNDLVLWWNTLHGVEEE